MCSIFGVLDLKSDAGALRSKALELSRLMRHRGPDWSGVYADNKAILVHESPVDCRCQQRRATPL